MHKESSDFMYGLLGKKLEHSFSKKIHEEFVNLEYSLIEKEEIYSFFIKRPFKGINVTIPYKKEVIQYLDELSPEAKEIGAVNTIINNSGKLTGYNTDYYGLEKALQYNDISVLDKVVAILGNGSTSRTIIAYCTKNLAKKIHVFARNPRENEYHFSDVENLKNCSIIFNATPVGMFPNNNDDMLIDLNSLPNLISVVDVLYNPLRSNLLIEAEKRGKKTVNGLLMLIWQAVKSIKLFHNIEISDDDVLKYYKKILMESYNLVFIGMPMSGKSFFASLCATQYSKKLIDLDNVIEKNNKDTIENIFQVHGEQYFRNLESKEILNYSKWHNQAISCGGGVVLNSNNIRNLKQNSIILFIDVPLEMLKKCNPKNRPLLKDKRNLVNLYNSRYELYKLYADIIIEKNTYDKDVTLNQIEVKINEYINS